MARLVRASFLSLKEKEFTEAARCVGVSNRRIMMRHLLPNAMVATVTFMPFILSGSVTTLTALINIFSREELMEKFSLEHVGKSAGVFDPDKLTALPAGSFYTEPAGVPHFIATPDGEAIVQVTGTGPTAVSYVDPAHAPKK